MDKGLDIYALFSLSSPGDKSHANESEAKPLEPENSSHNPYLVDFGHAAIQSVEVQEPVSRFHAIHAMAQVTLQDRPRLALVPEIEPLETEEDPQREIPEPTIKIAYEAITKVLEVSNKPRIVTLHLAEVAFGHSFVPRDEFEDFKQALRADARLNYLGDSEFEVIDRNSILTPEDWINSWHVDKGQIEELKEQIFDVIFNVLKRKSFGEREAIGIVKNIGHFLINEEADLLIGMIAADPRVKVLRNGDFYVGPEVEDSTVKKPPVKRSENERKQFEIRNNNRAKISRAIENINQLPEVQLARDREKNFADPRKLRTKKPNKGGKRLMGRTHGKKKTIEQLIIDMNKQQPGSPT